MSDAVPEQSARGQKLDKRLLKGSFWVTITEAAAGIVTFVTGALAARVLHPRDFGLMGTMMLAMSIVEYFSVTGFESALIHRQDNIEEYLDVAWTWHVLRGLLITAVLCASAVWLADFYDEPSMLWLIPAVSLSAFIKGTHNIGTLHFDRDLDFRTQFYIRLGTLLLRVLLYIPAIFILRNVWALVIAHLGGALAHVVVSYVSHPFRPKFRWDPKKLRELVSYGKWLTGMAIIGFFIGKGDDLFVSKYLGLVALGMYQLSYDVSNTPTTNITHVIGRVGLPTYARLQANKPELQRTFRNVMRATLLVSGPVSVFLFFAVDDYVAHIISDKWAPIIPLVQILVVSGYVRSFAALAGPLFSGTGRPDLDFKMNLPRFFCVVLGVWPAAHYFGLAGVCYVVLAAISLCIPTWLYGVHKLTGVTPRMVLSDNLLSWVSSAVLAAALYGVRPWFGPGVFGALGGLLCSLVAWLLALLVIGKVTPWNIYAEVDRLKRAIRQAREG